MKAKINGITRKKPTIEREKMTERISPQLSNFGLNKFYNAFNMNSRELSSMNLT